MLPPTAEGQCQGWPGSETPLEGQLTPEDEEPRVLAGVGGMGVGLSLLMPLHRAPGCQHSG